MAFKTGHPIHLCSDIPRIIRESMTNDDFMKELNGAFANQERLEATQESAQSWADRLEGIVKNHRWYINWITERTLDALQDRDPISRFVYMARTFFGCNVVLVARATADPEGRDAS